MTQWKECALGDIVTFQRGYDLPKPKMSGAGYPVIGSNGIIGFHHEYTAEAPAVTIGRSGNVGNPFIFYGRAWCHNTSLFVKEFKGADPVFTYYFLKTLDLGNYAGGSAVPTLNRNHIHALPVRVPASLEAQKRIGEFLKSLDDKITLNARINENLQQQAQIIFSSYYSRSSEIVPFTSVIDILGGGTPKTTNPIFWNGDIPFFTPKDIGFPYAFYTEKRISKEGLEHCNSRLYPINTVFVTARGTVGKVSLSGLPMAMNQSCYALAGRNIEFILVYFYALQAVRNLKHKASGAVFDAIVTRDFETESIRRLTSEDGASFCETVKPMFQSIYNNSLENLRLSSLRDTLLPRLMSGELDAPVAEAVTAAVPPGVASENRLDFQ